MTDTNNTPNETPEIEVPEAPVEVSELQKTIWNVTFIASQLANEARDLELELQNLDEDDPERTSDVASDQAYPAETIEELARQLISELEQLRQVADAATTT